VETVSEFTRRVKALLEEGIRPGWVRGEVSNLRAQVSGHVYFSLKDANARVAELEKNVRDLQKLVGVGLVEKIAKYDSNPANNPQTPAHLQG